MKQFFHIICALVLAGGHLFSASLTEHPLWKSDSLPALYYEVLAKSALAELELHAPDGRFRSRPLSEAAEERGWRITGMQYIYVPALLYASAEPANPLHGDKRMLDLALRAGDYLAGCIEPDGSVVPRINGQPVDALDAHRTLYCWTEAYGLLEKQLDPGRKRAWSDALRRAGTDLVRDLSPRIGRPRYTAPFLGYSPNHFGLRATTLWRLGMVLGIPEWVRLTQPALARFVREIEPGGYWAEHDGPTMNYDYLNGSVAGLYWHYSADPAALNAMRLNTDYHLHWCTPDGVDIYTVDERNRSDFRVNASWGLFTFSWFPEGRRFARFKLLAALGDSGNPLRSMGLETLARVAQDAHYHTSGPEAQIPQERLRYHHRLDRPAVVAKNGPWVYSISGLVSVPSPLNQFFLDRAAPVSLWHARTGHIIGGGNSKGQPELATFAARSASSGDWRCLPLDALINGEHEADTLCVAVEGFSLRLTFTPEDSTHATVSALCERTYNSVDSCFLNLPLKLFPGKELETGAGGHYTLSDQGIRLAGQELGQKLSHNGWSAGLPDNARFVWPFYTYTPYGPVRVPENLRAAVGVLSIPLAGDSSWVRVRFSVPGE